MLHRLFGGKKIDPRPGAIYAAIMAASRQKAFYTGLGVADSLEGRFELLIVHAILVARRLGAGSEEAKSLSQQVFDLMFADLDQALRESGASDLAVPKRIRRMAEAYYGRANAYDAALAEDAGQTALLSVVERNIYGTAPTADENKIHRQGAVAVVEYIKAADTELTRTDESLLLSGKLGFPAADDFVSLTRVGGKMENST